MPKAKTLSEMRAEINRLKGVNEAYRGALAKYANPINWQRQAGGDYSKFYDVWRPVEDGFALATRILKEN